MFDLPHDVMMLPLAGVLAVAVGAALGLLGGGGSILLVPLLVYVLGSDPRQAVVSSLLVVLLTTVVGLVPHLRAGRVDVRTGLGFGVASMLGAFGGSLVSGYVPAAVLLVIFAVMMAAIALSMRFGKTPSTEGPVRPAPLRTLSVGIAAGAMTGLVGAGGGFVVVPALVLLAGLGMERAVATSLLVIAMNATAALAGHLGEMGSVDLGVVLPVTVLAAGGAVLGARLSGRLRAVHLRRAFAWFVGLLSVLMLGREVPTLLGLPEDPVRSLVVFAVTTAVFAIGFMLDRARGARDGSLDSSIGGPWVPATKGDA